MQPKFARQTLDDIKQVNISYHQFMRINRLLSQFLSEHHFDDYYIDTDVGVENTLNLDVYLQNTNIDDCLRLGDEFSDILINDETPDCDKYKNILVHFIPSRCNNV